MCGLFFEKNHLLNWIILGVYSKIWPKYARISKQTDAAQNLIDDFVLTLTVGRTFHRKDFKWKQYGGTGLISEQTEALYAENNK